MTAKNFVKNMTKIVLILNIESLPLDFFIPMVERVFAKPKNTIYKN